MKSHIIALAALVVIGLAGAAVAGEAIKGPKAMTDAEMDAVTAGRGPFGLYSSDLSIKWVYGAMPSAAPRSIELDGVDLSQASTHENSIMIDIAVQPSQ